MGHYDERAMAERFGEDVIALPPRGECPDCGTPLRGDGGPCAGCGYVAEWCTGQDGCRLHESADECLEADE